jgi:hypothetical protein
MLTATTQTHRLQTMFIQLTDRRAEGAELADTITTHSRALYQLSADAKEKCCETRNVLHATLCTPELIAGLTTFDITDIATEHILGFAEHEARLATPQMTNMLVVRRELAVAIQQIATLQLFLAKSSLELVWPTAYIEGVRAHTAGTKLPELAAVRRFAQTPHLRNSPDLVTLVERISLAAVWLAPVLRDIYAHSAALSVRTEQMALLGSQLRRHAVKIEHLESRNEQYDAERRVIEIELQRRGAQVPRVEY